MSGTLFDAQHVLTLLRELADWPAVLTAARALAAGVEGDDPTFAQALRQLVRDKAETEGIEGHRKETIRLGELDGGRLEEAFARELETVLENIEDERTEAKATRTITITVTLAPADPERTPIALGVALKTKLAPRQGVDSRIHWGRTRDTGELAVREGAKPEQLRIYDLPPSGITSVTITNPATGSSVVLERGGES